MRNWPLRGVLADQKRLPEPTLFIYFELVHTQQGLSLKSFNCARRPFQEPGIPPSSQKKNKNPMQVIYDGQCLVFVLNELGIPVGELISK